MSAKAFYRVLGLKSYDFFDLYDAEDEISVTVELSREKWRCSECHGGNVHLHEWVYLRWRYVPVGLKPTWAGMSVPRVKCLNCGAQRRIVAKFAQGKLYYAGLREVRRQFVARSFRDCGNQSEY